MRYDPKVHHRRSVRLPNHDYAEPGAYFVTLCTHQRRWLFGAVAGEQMALNDAGNVVVDEWLQTAEVRPEVVLDDFVVMPNHLHGIVVIAARANAAVVGAHGNAPRAAIPGRTSGAHCHAPLQRHPRSLASLVGQFKGRVTTRVRRLHADPALEVWQRGYYEHVIRDEEELEAIRSYIAANPALWQYDHDNLQRLVEHVQHTRRLLAERRGLSERQLDLIARVETEYRRRMP